MAIVMVLFICVVGFIITQRIIELLVARNNENWIRSQGGYEVGANHYPYMVAIHIGFFISLMIEFIVFKQEVPRFWIPLFVVFIMLQMMRVCGLDCYAFNSRKPYLVLPGAHVVKKGPFNFIRHPNYVVVTSELIVIPLMFEAYFTAIVFSLLNFAILSVRIPKEEAALREVTDYKEIF